MVERGAVPTGVWREGELTKTRDGPSEGNEVGAEPRRQYQAAPRKLMWAEQQKPDRFKLTTNTSNKYSVMLGFIGLMENGATKFPPSEARGPDPSITDDQD